MRKDAVAVRATPPSEYLAVWPDADLTLSQNLPLVRKIFECIDLIAESVGVPVSDKQRVVIAMALIEDHFDEDLTRRVAHHLLTTDALADKARFKTPIIAADFTGAARRLQPHRYIR
jgi:hypothetical protein